MSERPALRWALRGGTLVVAGLLVWLAARDIAWATLRDVLLAVRWEWVVTAFATVTLSILLRGWRWLGLIRVAHTPTPHLVLAATATGYFGNAYMPARGGDVLRTVLLGRRAGLAKSFLLGTTLAERIGDVAVLMLVAAILLPLQDEVPTWIGRAGGIMAALVVVVLIVLWAWPSLHLPALKTWLMRQAARSRWLTYGAALMERFGIGARSLTKRTAPAFVAISLLAWGLDGVTIWVLTKAVGAPLPYALSMVFLIALALASAAPSTPGFIGVYQIVAVTVLVPLGMAQAEALALSVIYQVVTYGAFTLWGLIGMRYVMAPRSAAAANSEGT